MDQLNFTPEDLKAFKEVYAKEATDAQFAVFIAHCRQRDLVPGQDVVLQFRRQKDYDQETKAYVWRKAMVMVTTIYALRKIAERTGKYGGPLPPEWVYLDKDGQPNLVSKIPLPDTTNKQGWRRPWAAICRVRRTDWPEPVQGLARFDAYAQTYKGTNEAGEDAVVLSQTWRTRGPEQLAKCGFADAYRAAFPETQGLYIEEELHDDPDKTEAPAPVVPAGPAPTPVVAPAVNQTPAQPRPDSRPETGQPITVPKTATSVPVTSTALPVPSLGAAAQALAAAAPLVNEIASNPGIKAKLAEQGLQVDPRITQGLAKLATETAVAYVDHQVSPEVEAFVESLTPESPQGQPAAPTQVDSAPEPEPPGKGAAELSKEAAARLAEVPDAKERKEIGEKLKARKLDSDLLKNWMLRFTGAANIKKLTRYQWQAVNQKLDTVTELGQAALDQLLKPEAQ